MGLHNDPVWAWEKTDPTRSGSSGDLSKLFRNELIKQPGHLDFNAPSSSATLLAREVIQNSSDAAKERQDDGDSATQFQLDFRFQKVPQSADNPALDVLGVSELAQRAARCDRRILGLGDQDILNQDYAEDVPMLYISESGTTGMYGPFEGAKSKLYLALVSVGYTIKAAGSGGSYGYGKAGLIRASATRTIIAYTAFRERPDDPDVTRRLLGMTYWGQHTLDATSYTGFGRLGNEVKNGEHIPFTNEEADELAVRLGMEIRHPDNPADLGTTFLVLDPTVTPGDLKVAVERNWWPAIIRRDLFVRIQDYDKSEIIPRPRSNIDLSHYVRGWELATTPQDNQSREEHRVNFQTLRRNEGNYQLGTLGLVADLDGFSWPLIESTENGADVDHSLVALVRGPGMVVEYLKVGSVPPLVRGAFVADDEIDDLLRQTEPKAHDAWQKGIGKRSEETDVPSLALDIAGEVDKRIRSNVSAFRARLKPPVPKPEDVRLPLLNELFSQLLSSPGNKSGNPPAPPPRDVSINVDSRLEPSSENVELIQARGAITFRLTENIIPPATVMISVGYRFIEDGRVGDHCPLDIKFPQGSILNNDLRTAEVELTDAPLVITFKSSAYSPDWTAQLSAEAQLLESKGSQGLDQ